MMYSALTKLTGSALALSIALAPAVTLAKGNPHVEAEGNIRAQVEAKNPSGCLKAFGHLIAPGWIKKNGTVSVDANCSLPFGISVKLGLDSHPGHDDDHHATSTDTGAPRLFFIHVSNIGTSTARIGWTTNERATSQVEYGTTTAYGQTTTLNTNLTFNHPTRLSGLTPNTTYHYRVRSKDAAGNLTTSADYTFKTKATSDTTAPSLTSIAVSNIASTSAKVSWTTNESATGKVYYSSAATFNAGTASSTATTTLSTSHNFNLSGLNASTTYRYMVESRDAVGNTSTSAVGSFVTGL
jgi:phosphodiesterase/alkaline phosphatase D-like protein